MLPDVQVGGHNHAPSQVPIVPIRKPTGDCIRSAGAATLCAREDEEYITMAENDVCENAWYIIHGVSRFAYHNYKGAARGGFCNGSHENTGISRPRRRTIQAEANLMTIISGNAVRMPNDFRCIGGS
jgi:hypothetical protein